MNVSVLATMVVLAVLSYFTDVNNAGCSISGVDLNICEHTDWHAWDCSKCQAAAVRERNLCCPHVNSAAQCFLQCNFQGNIKESGSCDSHCQDTTTTTPSRQMLVNSCELISAGLSIVGLGVGGTVAGTIAFIMYRYVMRKQRIVTPDSERQRKLSTENEKDYSDYEISGYDHEQNPRVQINEYTTGRVARVELDE